MRKLQEKDKSHYNITAINDKPTFYATTQADYRAKTYQKMLATRNSISINTVKL